MGVSTSPGDAVPAAIPDAAERLRSGEDLADGIDTALSRLGAAVDVHRAYVFRNVRDPNGRLWMNLEGEWDAAGVRRIFDTPGNQLHPFAPDFIRWTEVLGAGEMLIGAVASLPASERRVLQGEDVVSVAVVPITVNDEWWGFVGIDDCVRVRTWTQEEIEAVRALAGAVGGSVAGDLDPGTDGLNADKFRSMVEQGPGVSYIDAPDDSAPTIYISQQVEALLGYTPQEWIDDADMWGKVLHPEDRARAFAENARHCVTGEPFRLEYRMLSKGGNVVWVHDEATIVRDETGIHRFSVGVLVDVTERKRGEELVAYHAYHDELTGLPSRAMFEELVELSVARAQRHNGSVAVVCVDLDDFRLANDSLGHQDGDALLRMVADRLRSATRETDLVARRGGDQFLLLLADLEREGAGDLDAAVVRAESAVQRVHEAMAAPFMVGSTELYLSASMGISLYPQDAGDPGGLQRNAEAAMYESKKTGPGGFVVSSRGSLVSAEKLMFVTRLRKAVESQRWSLYYQPVVDLESGETRGVEALIRWIEPDGTLIGPDDFIPLAEELGLIEAIGDWVVRELVFQAQAWRELDIDLEIGFNLSARQFWQPDLASRILARIGDGGIDPGRVVVEVTESSAMMDPDRAQDILWGLHRGGLQIAIDDFGTGYSSLSRLREMPVNVLKIDRSFVTGCDTDPQAGSIVAAFVELARGLGMTTLAEGIETEGELELLKSLGCQLGQGFLFSRPVPPEEIIARMFGAESAIGASRAV
ncbi:MAG: EAL domain-containing protein [Actinomycetota bacterium]|nr:EAL domain-containing protein [Actinomycetota bacterium]